MTFFSLECHYINLTRSVLSYKNILIYLGIGPKRHLDDVGLTTLLNRPGVGSNLQDHIMILMDGLTNSNEWLGFDPLWNIDPMKYLTWLLKNPYNGPLGDSGIGTGAFIHTPFENKDPFNRPQNPIMCEKLRHCVKNCDQIEKVRRYRQCSDIRNG